MQASKAEEPASCPKTETAACLLIQRLAARRQHCGGDDPPEKQQQGERSQQIPFPPGRRIAERRLAGASLPV